MTCNCNGKCGCGVGMIAKVLLIVGGLNWGLVGVGMLMNRGLNLVNMIFGSWPMVEAIVYIVVGVAAIVSIFGCPCAKCKACCAGSSTPSTGASM